MYAFINSRLGALLAFPIVLLCSLFLSITFADAASAIDGTWTDAKTITVNGVKYTGPTDGFINSGGSPNVASNYKVFTPTDSANKSRLYFNPSTNFDTAKTGSYTNTGFSKDGQALNLTNTRATAGAVPAPPTTDPDAEQTAQGSNCAIDGVGWLICPLATFLAKINDGAYAVVEQMLVFEIPDALSTDPEKNAVYGVWASIRNVANILFVIAFFAVIFSQATSVGISAYGIRKMLPRIIVAAILVNLSYYICIFAIDISNIVGAAFDGLIGAAAPEANKDNSMWETVGSTILAGQFLAASTGAMIAIAVFFSGFFLALAATAFLAIFFTLVILLVRHALLILLIVLSPLAFVAYILPNTESIFDKWRKTFISLLVMYPLIALLFAGSKLASDILMATHQGEADTGGWVSKLYLLMALGVLTIPLFGIPWIVKFSGGALARFSGAMNNKSKGLVDRARKYGEEGAKVRRGEAGLQIRRAGDQFANKTGGWGKNQDGTDADGKKSKYKRRMGKALGYAASRPTASYDKRENRKSRLAMAQYENEQDRFKRITGDVGSEPNEDDFRDPSTGAFNTAGYMAAMATYNRKKERGDALSERIVRSAAGVGGVRGQARVRALATEQRRKELGEDIKRATDDNLNNDLFNHNIKVFEEGHEGAGQELAMHERLAAIASGKAVVWQDAAGKHHRVDGSDTVQKYAAVSRLESTGDKKAAAAMYFSAKIKEKTRADFEPGPEGQTKYDVYLEDRRKATRYTVTDPVIRTEIERAIGSSAALGEAFPETRKSEAGAYNTTNAQMVSKLSKESAQLAYQFYDNQEVKLTSELTVARSSGDAKAIEVAERAVTNNRNARTNFENSIVQAIQNPTYSGNFDPGTLAEFEKQSGKKVADIAKGGTGTAAPTIVFETPPPATGGTPTVRSAADVRTQVVGAGGYEKLSDKHAYDTWQHAGDPRLSSDPDAATLRAEAEAELKKRGILPT